MVLLQDVHKDALYPGDVADKESLLRGSYKYFHYECDGHKDKGWGCGYRTLQTMCSWIEMNHRSDQETKLPSIPDIQKILVQIEDKPKNFIGSIDWIGSIEASYVLSDLYDWDCKIVHVRSGGHLSTVTSNIATHFDKGGGPIMAGGDVDGSAKCIVGVKGKYLLIVDPHFVGTAKTKKTLQNDGWVRWQDIDEFLPSSFYNLCLPIPPKSLS